MSERAEEVEFVCKHPILLGWGGRVTFCVVCKQEVYADVFK